MTEITKDVIKQFVTKYGINCFDPYIYFEHGLIQEFDQHPNSGIVLAQLFEQLCETNLNSTFEIGGIPIVNSRRIRRKKYDIDEADNIVHFSLYDKRTPCEYVIQDDLSSNYITNFVSKSNIVMATFGTGYAITPLMYTCSYRMFDIALKLIATGEKNLRIDMIDENGETALLHLFNGLHWRIGIDSIRRESDWNVINEEKERDFDQVCLALLATGKSRPATLSKFDLFSRKPPKSAYTIAIQIRKFALAEAIYRQTAWEKRREFVIGVWFF